MALDKGSANRPNFGLAVKWSHHYALNLLKIQSFGNFLRKDLVKT